MSNQTHSRVHVASSGQRFVLSGIDWKAYRQISETLTEHHVRLTFDRGNLEFVTKSPRHTRLSRFLMRMVVVLTEETAQPLACYGGMTCDRKDLDRGIEPDECFYISNEPRIRGKAELDFAIDPPPDLVIEIELSQDVPNRQPIFAAIGIPEVWRCDGRNISFMRNASPLTCQQSALSQYFSRISDADLSAFLNRREVVEENVLMQEFREYVRERLRE